MARTPPGVGRAFLKTYRGVLRARNKAFSMLASGGFARFGAHTVLALPIRLEGEQRIAIGEGVFVGAGSWLHVEGSGTGVAIEIGDGSSIGAYSTLSAVHSLRVGRRVLTARAIYVSDHSHHFADPDRAIKDQGLAAAAAVEIADGAWLGENVVVCPGVRIGRGAVIGANSVVTADIPDGAVAVGAPARVVRQRDGTRAE
jgi:carbonic anhydrase/acetyltransferase-like protein (isoleucine patch superfamily)